MAAVIVTPVFRPQGAPGAEVERFLRAASYWFFSDRILYTDTSPATIFRIPAGMLVTGAGCEVLTAFVGTTPVLSLGVSGVTGRHLATTDITATTLGFYETAKGWHYDVNADLIVTIGGTSLTAGIARFWIEVRFNDTLQPV